MKLGVVGLPNVGKSTLFNAITKAGAEVANYPFCTIEPNVGVVNVPDPRLDVLTKMFDSKKTTPAHIEFVDIAGLVKGASRGEGLGNKFLSHIREVDAIVHTVRCFNDSNIIHVNGAPNPSDDIDTINTELILSDLEMVENRLNKTKKLTDKASKEECVILQRLYDTLAEGKSARSIDFDEDELKIVKGFFLLTTKPVIYVANISENDIGQPENEYVQEVRKIAQSENSEVISLCAKIESELAGLDDEDREMFREEYGLKESGLDKLIVSSYKTLGLISYLTAGPTESRAWTITKGTKAPQAAGKIHSDFEKGFIRAEVVSYDDLVKYGSMTTAKAEGKVRSEGKEYVVADGDVVLFRFNV